MITRNTDYSIQRLRGLSTDTKPTDVPNGSEFREMDTGKKFLFSEAGAEWIEQPCCGGGSGGGSVEPLIVQLKSKEIGEPNILDKTWQDIFDALSARKPVYFSSVEDVIHMATFVPIGHVYYSNNKYNVPIMGLDGRVTVYMTDNANDYPGYGGGA